ncbi:lymphocyte-specific helicase-like [Nasonia vitripennis]|uniref:Lymphoid-specific helicase n=1 Tax=Nasonia vitripennis TaxID=7425 RepID=A0A7M7TA63_NASVI|nr:lymphocyte-specific helicase-like [Nasonia vitripennis]
MMFQERMDVKNETKAEEKVSRDVMDPSEDSGFESIVSKDQAKKENEGTIGEGIDFADTARIAEEQRLKLERKRRMNEEELAKRRAAAEEYEQEMKEKQYKRLMHLLSQSKVLSSFIMKKFEPKDKDKDTKAPKRTGIEEAESAVPNKRTRRALKQTENTDKNKAKSRRGRKKLNLNIKKAEAEELASKCKEEPSGDKENSNPIDNFVQSKLFQGELRDYQKEGVEWMKSLQENGLNGILADEMGLGKTIQVIALFAYLIENQIAGPYLVVVPLSTLTNWTLEFERFAPQLPVVVYYGNGKERAPLRNKIRQRTRVGSFLTHPIVLTTYETPIKDGRFLQEFHWRYIVVDEAQRIKNFNCQLFKKLRLVDSVNRLVLTGTPIHNNLSELWSLLHFLLPDIFNSLDIFKVWFDASDVQHEAGKQKFLKQEQERHVLSALKEILEPFMLRRLKEDVCPDVPPMKEVIVYTPLTAIQYDLYSSIINRDVSALWKVKPEEPVTDINRVRPKRKCTQSVSLDQLFNRNKKKTEVKTQMVGNKVVKTEDLNKWKECTNVTEQNVDYLIRLRFGNDVMMYRHVVNHPYIIHYPLNDAGVHKIDESLVKISGKMLVLDAMLKKLHANGNKVLLFSTMTMVLDVIEDYLSLRDFQYVRLDGRIKLDERSKNIETFQNDPDVFLFLLSTRAGAVGLNLAAADTVILYDSDWNPQCDLQAMARCHRIGQIKPVVAYRFCTKGTVDQYIINRANVKRVLEKTVMPSKNELVNTEDGLTRLKRLLENECMRISDSKNEVYTDAELNALLDRSDMVLATKASDSKS